MYMEDTSLVDSSSSWPWSSSAPGYYTENTTALDHSSRTRTDPGANNSKVGKCVKFRIHGKNFKAKIISTRIYINCYYQNKTAPNCKLFFRVSWPFLISKNVIIFFQILKNSSLKSTRIIQFQFFLSNNLFVVFEINFSALQLKKKRCTAKTIFDIFSLSVLVCLYSLFFAGLPVTCVIFGLVGTCEDEPRLTTWLMVFGYSNVIFPYCFFGVQLFGCLCQKEETSPETKGVDRLHNQARLYAAKISNSRVFKFLKYPIG